MWQFIQGHNPQAFDTFEIMLMKCFPHQKFLQCSLTCAWLKMGYSKVYEDNYQMMCGIMGLGDFGQTVLSMVVHPIVCSMTSLELRMPQNPKPFQALIVNNNQNLKKSRSPFAKDLITSTHPRFHTMVVSGQPKPKPKQEKTCWKMSQDLHFKTHIP